MISPTYPTSQCLKIILGYRHSFLILYITLGRHSTGHYEQCIRSFTPAPNLTFKSRPNLLIHTTNLRSNIRKEESILIRRFVTSTISARKLMSFVITVSEAGLKINLPRFIYHIIISPRIGPILFTHTLRIQRICHPIGKL